MAMSSEEDISTLYAGDLAPPMEDVKNSCFIADEHRRLLEENHRLAEEKRALMNSLILMNQKMEKMQAHFSFISLKQQIEKREEDIRDLRKILMEVVEQNKKLKDAVHVSEHARQEIKTEFEILRKLLSPIKPRAQTHTHTQTELVSESEIHHDYPRIAPKDQEIGDDFNETEQNSSMLIQRNLSPSTEVRMDITVKSVQGNLSPTTQNDYGQTAGQKSLMEGKTKEFRSKIPLYQKSRAQHDDMKNKSTDERSNANAKETNKYSPKPAQNPIRARNQEVHSPSVSIPSSKTVVNKERVREEQDTIEEIVTTKFAKMPRKIARYKPPETKQITEDSIHRGNKDTSGQETLPNRTKDVYPDASSAENLVQRDLNQEPRIDRERSLSCNMEGSYQHEGQFNPGKPGSPKGTNQDSEPVFYSLPMIFRNNLLKRERYYSDKEVNYIFEKLLKEEKAGYQSGAKIDPTTGKMQKPEYSFKGEDNSSITKPNCNGEQRRCAQSPQLKQENEENLGVSQQRPKFASSLELHSQSVNETSLHAQDPTNYNVPDEHEVVVQNSQLKHDDVPPQNASPVNQENASPSVETRESGIDTGKAENQSPTTYNPYVREGNQLSLSVDKSEDVSSNLPKFRGNTSTTSCSDGAGRTDRDTSYYAPSGSVNLRATKIGPQDVIDSHGLHGQFPDERNSQPELARMDQSEQVLPEQFRNELVSEKQPLNEDTFHQVPYKNPEISERNSDADRHISQSSIGTAKEESGHAQELRAPKMEMESESLDAGLENDGNGKDLPRVDEADIYQGSDSSSSGRAVIGDPVATSTPRNKRFMMEPIATSTPKAFEEHALNQVVPNRSQSSSDAMDSDSGTAFDQKLLAALKILGTRVIGEIAFQLDRRILETVFRRRASASNDELIKNRVYGYTSQNIGALITKETLRGDGTRNLHKESFYRKRHEKLLYILKDHGYNKMVHEEFVKKMVEKYGTLNATPSKKVIQMYGLEEPKLLEALLGEVTADKAEFVHTLVLLDCLRAMSSWDGVDGGGSLFKW